MSRKRNSAAEPASGCSVWKIVTGGIIGLVFTFLLTFAAAFAVSREYLPLSSCSRLGPVIIALSALCSSCMAARRNCKKLVCGLLAAAVYGLALMICGMLLFSAPMKAGRLTLSAGALLLGALGGVILAAFRE